jgi:hypothetical protein
MLFKKEKRLLKTKLEHPQRVVAIMNGRDDLPRVIRLDWCYGD